MDVGTQPSASPDSNSWYSVAHALLWRQQLPALEQRRFDDNTQGTFLTHNMNKEEEAKALPILVRAVYMEIYRHITSSEFNDEAKMGKGGLVIWGQPGVGKSMFLTYALSLALYDRTPVLFIPPGRRWFYFSEDGSKLLQRDDRGIDFVEDLIRSQPGLLVLVDSAGAEGVPSDLERLPARLVLASSPKASRFRGWCKQRCGEIWIVNPWTSEEIEVEWQALLALRPALVSCKSPVKKSETLGGIARSLFNFPDFEASRRNDSETIGLQQQLTTESFVTAAKSYTAANPFVMSENPAFYNVFRIFGDDSSPYFYDFPPRVIMSFLSPAVEAAARSIMMEWDIMALKKFVLEFGHRPLLTGVVFEAAAIKRIPTAKIDKFHGALYEGESRSSIRFPPARFTEPKSIEIPRKSPGSPFDIAKHELYVPQSGYPAFDAFVKTDEHINLLQMSISKQHPIKHRLVRRLYKRLKPEDRSVKWRLLYIVPSVAVGEALITPKRRKGVKIVSGVKLYVGYIVFGLGSKYARYMAEVEKILLQDRMFMTNTVDANDTGKWLDE